MLGGDEKVFVPPKFQQATVVQGTDYHPQQQPMMPIQSHVQTQHYLQHQHPITSSYQQSPPPILYAESSCPQYYQQQQYQAQYQPQYQPYPTHGQSYHQSIVQPHTILVPSNGGIAPQPPVYLIIDPNNSNNAMPMYTHGHLSPSCTIPLQQQQQQQQPPTSVQSTLIIPSHSQQTTFPNSTQQINPNCEPLNSTVSNSHGPTKETTVNNNSNTSTTTPTTTTTTPATDFYPTTFPTNTTAPSNSNAANGSSSAAPPSSKPSSSGPLDCLEELAKQMNTLHSQQTKYLTLWKSLVTSFSALSKGCGMSASSCSKV